MNAPDITDDAIFTAVRAFLLGIVPAPAIEIVQGQVNRTPPPAGADYMVMWPTRRAGVATPVSLWDQNNVNPQVIAHQLSTQFDIQLEIHGPRAADLTQIVVTLWRTEYACETLAPIAAPLTCDGGRQMPFRNAQEQTEDRWVIGLELQANPIVSTAQQFADTLTVDLKELDATYPPEP